MHIVQGSRRDPVGLAHPGRVFAITSVALLVIDQVTKAVVRATMHVGDSIGGVVPRVLNLTFVRNSGAAFGLFPGQRPFFVLTSLLVLFAIAAYWRRVRPRQLVVVVALALIAGGSIGNLADRVVAGRVTDFFEFAFVQFPVFNFADAGLFCGVGLLMLWILFGPETSNSAHTTPVASDAGEPADLEVEEADRSSDMRGDRVAAAGHEGADGASS